jgi:hypothetical protein
MPPVAIQITKLLYLADFNAKEGEMMLNDIEFTEYIFNSRKEILTSVDANKNYIIKIQIKKNINKAKYLLTLLLRRGK